MVDQEFDKLLSTVAEISSYFPDGVIFIGGIAVYLHAANHEETVSMKQTTHDADMYISLADMGDLRDIEEVTPNRRLSKHQMIKNNFEFDIYTERQSSLSVPYDQVMANSVIYDSVRVAGLEELLVLKMRAFQDRKGTAKGEKDARDIIRIAEIGYCHNEKFDAERIAGYFGEDELLLLRGIENGPDFMAFSKGNAMKAKALRNRFNHMVKKIERALQMESPASDEPGELSKTYNATRATKEYIGIIKDVDDKEIILSVGRNKFVSWNRKDISGVEPEIGDRVVISSEGRLRKSKTQEVER